MLCLIEMHSTIARVCCVVLCCANKQPTLTSYQIKDAVTRIDIDVQPSRFVTCK
jgi:hypothetical protein